ncbi:MAG: Nudix family hydrolase [Alcanivoracaceae bacterium]|nr:Nudix family hydrolase [Alcanivoracaceae bacterium]
MKRLDVVAAIIRDTRGRVLLSRRPADKHQGGLWEFPGGKVEPGESPDQALAREIDEELGLAVARSQPFMTISHDYPELCVRLMFRDVVQWSGEPHGREGQPVTWQPLDTLQALDFPEANRPLLSALRLPDQILILPADLPSQWPQRLQAALAVGAGMVYPRRHTDAALLADIAALCRQAGASLMVADDAALCARVGADVLHLTHRVPSPPADYQGLLSVACHDAGELRHAADIGADMVLLSPVHATPTHPHAPPLGWQSFSSLAQGQPFAVYALGGVSPAMLMQAREAGARGVAGISAFW